MVMGAETIEEILPRFMEFCEGCVMIAHNAEFDMSFIRKNCMDLDIHAIIPLAIRWQWQESYCRPYIVLN